MRIEKLNGNGQKTEVRLRERLTGQEIKGMYLRRTEIEMRI